MDYKHTFLHFYLIFYCKAHLSVQYLSLHYERSMYYLLAELPGFARGERAKGTHWSFPIIYIIIKVSGLSELKLWTATTLLCCSKSFLVKVAGVASMSDDFSFLHNMLGNI